MKLDENRQFSFFKLCATEQSINPIKAPTSHIYINRLDMIPPKALAPFGADEPNEIMEWYRTFLKKKYSYFVMLQLNTSDQVYDKFNISQECKKIWDEILSIWNQQEENERIIYVLRTNQVEKGIINREFYNTLEEFNEWVNIIDKCLPSCFEYMETHFSQESDNAIINYHCIIEAINTITQSIINRNSISERGFLKAFTQSIKELFYCEICDYFIVEDKIIRIYATSFEPESKEFFNLQDSEFYKEGAGITGAVMLGTNEEQFFHVGTNCLSKDGRQSPWHTNAYSKFYKEENLHSFWVFPLYADGELVAAFRVINKIIENNVKVAWTYEERIQLVYIAQWFQNFFQLSQMYNQFTPIRSEANLYENKHNVTTRVFNDCFKDIDSAWVKPVNFEKIIEHLVRIVHRKIESKKLGCCLFLCDSKTANHLFTVSELEDYIIFDNSKKNVGHYNSNENRLLLASESYSIILPTSGIFIWDEDIKFWGVKSLGTTPFNKECKSDNMLENMTTQYKNSFAFLLERGHNSILIYTDGLLKYEYYLSDYSGYWNTRSYYGMLKAIKIALNIVSTEEIKSEQINNIFKAAWWMSYRRIGSMIVISNNENVKSIHKKSEKSMEIKKPLTTLMSNNMIYDLAMRDGGILMDYDGIVHYGSAQFKHKNKLTEDLEKNLRGKGTRHHTAGHISCGEKETLILTISENRGISAFYQGVAIFMDN